MPSADGEELKRWLTALFRLAPSTWCRLDTWRKVTSVPCLVLSVDGLVFVTLEMSRLNHGRSVGRVLQNIINMVSTNDHTAISTLSPGRAC